VSELFDEIDEEMRAERLAKLWKEYAPYVIGVMAVVLAGVGGWRYYTYLEAEKSAKVSVVFDRAVILSEQNNHADAEALFNELSATAPKGYRSLARLHAAGEVAARDVKAAARMFDDIAADSSIGVAQRQLAEIRAAGLLLDNAGYAEMLRRLERFTVPSSSFRHTAREMLALSAWREGDMASARKWVEAVQDDPETPEKIRERVVDALGAMLPEAGRS